MKIVVGSTNPVKINVVQNGFRKLFPGIEPQMFGCAAKSGISDQPMSREETFKGAKNRAYHAREMIPQADYWVGIEGGMDDTHGIMQEFAWIFVLSKDGKESKSHSPSFTVPTQIALMVRGGMEHGPASDRFFKVEDSKRTNGTIGLISNDVLTRTSYQETAVICAFIPFLHPEWYFD